MTIYNGGVMGYILIEPIKAKFSDDNNSTRLYSKIIADNLNSECLLYWELQDDFGNRTMKGNVAISGDDYSSWLGDSEFIFNYILSSSCCTSLTLLS